MPHSVKVPTEKGRCEGRLTSDLLRTDGRGTSEGDAGESAVHATLSPKSRGTIGALAPGTALARNRVWSLTRSPDARQKRPGGGTRMSSGSREFRGENSPHYTNQPEKTKMNRVLVKYFSGSTRGPELIGGRVAAGEGPLAGASVPRGGSLSSNRWMRR